ncbi:MULTISPECIES: phosphatidate cytidylyltransferase [Exiguobacterium]|uniref:phosphatidate cytidylyltransferase n=1 Tax=Exiguobacterium TaxID=33986 RepID=UPI001BEC3C64|nr:MULTISPECIES: phosphatidate cytidylyltransferase [Exiguobacterium]MCT4776168.1 phosphatidate cytidylyltransferase [Exiguobacterium aquaticum]MCT4787944.1 phosphatidate cytidylyltransferase [Exiguobacterium mexicanum]
MKTRIITGLWAGAIFVTLIALGGSPFVILMGVLALIGLSEFTLMRNHKLMAFPFLVTSLLVAFPFILLLLERRLVLDDLPMSTNQWMVLGLMLLLFWTVVTKNRFTYEDASFYFVSAVYLVVGFSSFALVRLSEDGLVKVLLVLFMIWATDSGAYFTGKAIGKTKLWPSISPNKTIEGAIGGIISAIVLGIVYVLIEPVLPILEVLVLAVVVSVVGQLGDLVQSAYKRQYNVKDSGHLLPGHGGILDRFDSMIAVFTVIWVFNLL